MARIVTRSNAAIAIATGSSISILMVHSASPATESIASTRCFHVRSAWCVAVPINGWYIRHASAWRGSMPIQLHSLRAAIVFIAAIVLSIGWGVWATVRHQEPRSLERSGAAIAAIAAIAVLFQIRTELKIEEERNALSRQAQEAHEVE